MYALHIYQKYCCTKSKFQINLPANISDGVYKNIEKKKTPGLVHIFDDAQGK